MTDAIKSTDRSFAVGDKLRIEVGSDGLKITSAEPLDLALPWGSGTMLANWLAYWSNHYTFWRFLG